MRNKSNIVVLLAVFMLISFSICGCENNPNDEIVTSKNDNTFDVNILQPASTEITHNENKVYHFADTFCSTDGSVEFEINIEENQLNSGLPVVEVVPHYITEADAKRIANVLFENETFYEARPIFDVKYSLGDIEAYINRWVPYTNTNALSELYGTQDTVFLNEILDSVKNALQVFQQMADKDVVTSDQELCNWEFKPESYYKYDAEELRGEDLSQDNDEITAELVHNGIPYIICFSKRDKSDFKLNYIYAYPHSYNSPMDIDSAIFRAQLCRTEEPSDEQIDRIKEETQDMLDRMELGDWVIDECYLQTNSIGQQTEYIIYINAVPIMEGIPVVRQPQLTYLKSEANYASNYYLSDARFMFSANGELIKFEMFSPIDIKDVINTNVATLPMDELFSKAITHLSLTDYHEYGVYGEALIEKQKAAGEEFVCHVEICEMEYGMLRVRVPNSDESYYYVPGMILYGTIDYLGKETQKLYESSGTTIWEDRIVPLVALNAVDGSIIELSNE